MLEVLLSVVGRLASDGLRGLIQAATRRRRFTPIESQLLQTAAFLESERHGVGAEATLKLGNEVIEDLDWLAAYESLLRDGYIVPGQGSRLVLTATGQQEAIRMLDRAIGRGHRVAPHLK